MRVRLLLVTFLASAAVLAGGGGPAAGQTTACPPTAQYPPSALGLQLSKTEVTRGESIQITGTCFLANTVVSIEFLPGPVSLGSAQTNAQGTFARTVTIPADATPGAHTIVASDGTNRLTATVSVLGITITRGDTSGLPRTGAAFTIPFGIAGVALIAVGTLAVLATRRKRAAG